MGINHTITAWLKGQQTGRTMLKNSQTKVKHTLMTVCCISGVRGCAVSNFSGAGKEP